MNTYLTRNEVCDCRATTGTGGKRPKKCEHENRFWTEAQIAPPKPRPPLAAISPKRAAEEEAGTAPMPKRRPLKQSRRRETSFEREAREHFNEVVKGYPCWFRITRPCGNCNGAGEVETLLEGDFAKATCAACGGDGRHHCSGEKDAHHVVKKQFIRRMFQAVLPEPKFVAILFNPKIGAPLCRYGSHEPVERGQARIYWEDLSEECVEYVGSLPDFMLIELERQCPKRSAELGGRRRRWPSTKPQSSATRPGGGKKETPCEWCGEPSTTSFPIMRRVPGKRNGRIETGMHVYACTKCEQKAREMTAEPTRSAA